jgi:hypothetical protein
MVLPFPSPVKLIVVGLWGGSGKGEEPSGEKSSARFRPVCEAESQQNLTCSSSTIAASANRRIDSNEKTPSRCRLVK